MTGFQYITDTVGILFHFIVEAQYLQFMFPFLGQIVMRADNIGDISFSVPL